MRPGRWHGRGMSLSPDPDIAILGAGAFGRALAIQARRAGQTVTGWARRAVALDGLGWSPEADCGRARLVVVAVPVAHAMEVLRLLGLTERPLVLACKGMDADGRFPAECLPHVALLSGPTFAHEIARGLPAAAVIASADAALRQEAMARLGSRGLRLYPTDDLAGAMVCGAAKNVVAIAAGGCIGMGLGENARAALVTRGLAEIGRLAVAMGGRAETVSGLSGMGDLMLTCAGAASRNYAFGLALGAGASVGDALAASRGVVEGHTTAPALVRRAEGLGVDMPISAAVAGVLAGRMTVRAAMEALLARPVRVE